MTSSLASNLDTYLQEQEGRAFDWPTFNCCHFAQGWVQRQEGHALNLVPRVKDRKSALRIIHDRGGREAAISKAIGREPIPVTMARPGDLVLFRSADSAMLGICCGRTGACIGEGVGNIVHIEMTQACAAWPVGAHV